MSLDFVKFLDNVANYLAIFEGLSHRHKGNKLRLMHQCYDLQKVPEFLLLSLLGHLFYNVMGEFRS